MEKLDRVYGKASYEEWTTKHPSDLADTKVSPKTAGRDAWNVDPWASADEIARIAVSEDGTPGRELDHKPA